MKNNQTIVKMSVARRMHEIATKNQDSETVKECKNATRIKKEPMIIECYSCTHNDQSKQRDGESERNLEPVSIHTGQQVELDGAPKRVRGGDGLQVGDEGKQQRERREADGLEVVQPEQPPFTCVLGQPEANDNVQRVAHVPDWMVFIMKNGNNVRWTMDMNKQGEVET